MFLFEKRSALLNDNTLYSGNRLGYNEKGPLILYSNNDNVEVQQ